MDAIELKLKQASAVLGVAPKDLQNLVQFKVLRPIRRDSFYWFDNRLLLEAKIALYLKESLGTSTEVLALFTRALSSLKDEDVATVRYLSLRSRPMRGREPIEVRIPLRDLAKELNEQLPLAAVYKDLPRGRPVERNRVPGGGGNSRFPCREEQVAGDNGWPVEKNSLEA